MISFITKFLPETKFSLDKGVKPNGILCTANGL